ncbi:SURF1 family protein [Marinospirillum perlucidum]|uniref:SURF1 family protein n=1 Tax=Marinospirillum perlucidum TaxID=1982602 RepID=UPI000DF27A8E|nr:SURF1 family protein [Marinospirillum perlucidum]
MASSRQESEGHLATSGVEARQAVKEKASWAWYLFWLSLVVLGLVLAFWQYQRGLEKQVRLQALAEQPLRIQPEQLPLNLAPVQLRGEFLGERTLWLDNRIYQGQVGVAALTPLRTGEGRWWLVDRGFVATGADRSGVPRLTTPSGQVQLSGSWQLLNDEDWVWGPNREGERLQAVDLSPWADLPGEAFAGVLHQQSGPGLLQPWWSANSMPPARHWGYSVQWLLLALLAFWMAWGPARPGRKRKSNA